MIAITRNSISGYFNGFLFLMMVSIVPALGCGDKAPEVTTPQVYPAVKELRVLLPENASQVIQNIRGVFFRQVRQRSAVNISEASDAALTIALTIEPGIGAEGFRIADSSKGTIRISGNDERGLLYGIGKFLRTSRFGEDGFTAGSWRGVSVPQKSVRGIYLATHFHNFYHVAPVEEMKRYVEDIALWGYNVLLVWYGMNHFNGFSDPEAVVFRERLHLILKVAHDIGLDVAWGDAANGGYKNSPDSIRATSFTNKGAQFAFDVCPSLPGGQEYILNNAERVLKDFADVNPKYYFIWPYDNGGCNSKDCQPWATNGYIRMSRLLGDQLRSHIPNAKIILSTWLFSADERRKFRELISIDTSKGLADYLISDADSVFDGTVGAPLLAFPEITMLGWAPWGGFGAAPLPARYEKEWRNKSKVLSGGFPYSEGIYDDINKVLYAQFYWQPDRSAEDIIREYVAFEFSPDIVEEMTQVTAILEANHKRKDISETAIRAFQLVQQGENKLTAQAKKSWRWRLFYLRCLIDQELFRMVPQPEFKQGEGNKRFVMHATQGGALQKAFEELKTIYHADKIDPTDENDVWLLPPQVKQP